MKNLTVSVVLPTFNRAGLVSRAIESVLRQSFRDFELVVVDNASQDNTAEVLSEFARRDTRVKVIRNSKNLGPVKSMNKGVDAASGKYIARIDDDDEWIDDNKLKKQVSFLENNLDYVLVGGGVIKVDERGKEIVRHLLPQDDQKIRDVMLQDNPFASSSVVFRKSAFEQTGGYDDKLAFSEDWDLWMRLGRFGKYHNFQEYFFLYLQGTANRSSQHKHRNLWVPLVLCARYRREFPHFWKAYAMGWALYIFSFFPFRRFLRPVSSRLRRVLFGHPGYKSFTVKD